MTAGLTPVSPHFPLPCSLGWSAIGPSCCASQAAPAAANSEMAQQQQALSAIRAQITPCIAKLQKLEAPGLVSTMFQPKGTFIATEKLVIACNCLYWILHRITIFTWFTQVKAICPICHVRCNEPRIASSQAVLEAFGMWQDRTWSGLHLTTLQDAARWFKMVPTSQVKNGLHCLHCMFHGWPWISWIDPENGTVARTFVMCNA